MKLFRLFFVLFSDSITIPDLPYLNHESVCYFNFIFSDSITILELLYLNHESVLFFILFFQVASPF